MDDALLTTEEACNYLKISKYTLYEYVKRKEIPAFKFGRRWKFSKSTLEKWVDEKMQESKISVKK